MSERERMGADAAGSSSLSVPELHRQLAELGEELRLRKESLVLDTTANKGAQAHGT